MTPKLGYTPLYGSGDFLSSLNSATNLENPRVDLLEGLGDMRRRYNFDHIELRSELFYLIPDLLAPASIASLKTFLVTESVSLSVHLPYLGLDISSFNHHSREGSVNSIVDIIERTRELDPASYVLHPSGHVSAEIAAMGVPPRVLDEVMTVFAGYTTASVQQVLERTWIDPHQLAVENVDTPFSVFAEMVDLTGTSVCMDVGHLLSGETPDYTVSRFLEDFSDKVSLIHLHDGSAVQGSHKALGSCDSGLPAIIDGISRAGVNVPMVLEMSARSVEASLSYLRNCDIIL